MTTPLNQSVRLAQGISTYFVPGIRLRKLPAQLAAASQPGTGLDADVIADILRAEVTLVSSGAAQYSITFSNWYASTATDRGGSKPVGLREVRGRTNGPLWPRYKYNDFSLLAFGQRLRIDMRYFPKARGTPGAGKTEEDDTSTGAADPYGWVPMVSGPITDMRFDFSASGAQVTVSGEDDLSRLKDRHEGRKEFPNRGERQIVSDVLGLAKYPLRSVAQPLVPWPPFADSGGTGIAEALGDGQSYLEYLQKLAERLDFEVFLEFSDLGQPSSAQRFHFEPSRSRAKPGVAGGSNFILDREQNLLEFSPTIKVVDQPTDTTVKGRHRDRNNPTRVTKKALPVDVLYDELHVDDKQDQPLKSGPEIRDRYFPGRPNTLTLPNQTNIDDERAEHLAESILRRKAREFFTVEGTTIGLPRLRPGQHVEVRGMRPPFDGFFYVTKTVHTYGPDGMRTRFSARRPGMPEPPFREPDNARGAGSGG